jgi:hypothetical protein
MAVLAVSLLAACGGSSTPQSIGGAGTVSGIVGGVPPPIVTEAVSVIYSGADCHDSTKQASAVYIMLGSRGGMCAAAQGNGTYTGTLLMVEVANNATASAQPITPGTYDINIGANPVALSIYGRQSNGCNTTSLLSGSGTITITSVSAAGAKGSYEISFVNGQSQPAGTLSGTFDTVNCSLNQAQACSAGSSSC